MFNFPHHNGWWFPKDQVFYIVELICLILLQKTLKYGFKKRDNILGTVIPCWISIIYTHTFNVHLCIKTMA